MQKIQNPETGKWVNINGKVGKKVLNNYVHYINQTGGLIPKGVGNALKKTPMGKLQEEIKKLIQRSIDKLSEDISKKMDTNVSNLMNKQEDNNQKIMRLLTADLELKDFYYSQKVGLKVEGEKNIINWLIKNKYLAKAKMERIEFETDLVPQLLICPSNIPHRRADTFFQIKML